MIGRRTILFDLDLNNWLSLCYHKVKRTRFSSLEKREICVDLFYFSFFGTMSDTACSSQSNDFMVIDQFDSNSTPKRPPGHLFSPQLFEVHVKDYEEHLHYRGEPMTDAVIRIVIHQPGGGFHCDFGRLKNLPLWVLDSLLDRCSGRKQHSPLSWTKALDLFGWFSVNEDDFKYSPYVDTTRVQV